MFLVKNSLVKREVGDSESCLAFFSLVEFGLSIYGSCFLSLTLI
jgi:hypothetical protein